MFYRKCYVLSTRKSTQKPLGFGFFGFCLGFLCGFLGFVCLILGGSGFIFCVEFGIFGSVLFFLIMKGL